MPAPHGPSRAGLTGGAVCITQPLSLVLAPERWLHPESSWAALILSGVAEAKEQLERRVIWEEEAASFGMLMEKQRKTSLRREERR